MGVVGTIICIVGRSNYGILMAGRVIQGFGATAFESLSLAVVGDIFYLHQRGWRTALIVLTLACMASLVSIISGVITEELGYKNLFIILLPFQVAGLLGTVFFLPESQFIRETREVMAATEENHLDEKESSQDVETCHEETKNGNDTLPNKPTSGAAARNLPAKKTYLQTLAPFTKVYTDENPFIMVAKIFLHLLNPAVMWILTTSAVMVVSFCKQDYSLR
jgi:MFS family permease